MSVGEDPACPHCGVGLSKWATPQDSTWSVEFMYVCFNNECPYYVRGWTWMEQQYGVKASYRYRLDPETGKSGPLPVVSPTALKGDILS